jgi:hypothetical protein
MRIKQAFIRWCESGLVWWAAILTVLWLWL